jgi:hypothetical protein
MYIRQLTDGCSSFGRTARVCKPCADCVTIRQDGQALPRHERRFLVGPRGPLIARRAITIRWAGRGAATLEVHHRALALHYPVIVPRVKACTDSVGDRFAVAPESLRRLLRPTFASNHLPGPPHPRVLVMLGELPALHEGMHGPIVPRPGIPICSPPNTTDVFFSYADSCREDPQVVCVSQQRAVGARGTPHPGRFIGTPYPRRPFRHSP